MNAATAPLEVGQQVTSTIPSLNVRTGRIIATRKPRSHTGIQMVQVKFDSTIWPEWQLSTDLKIA